MRGKERLIAVVSELGLRSAAQAASLGSLPGRCSSCLFVGALWHLFGGKQHSGWEMLNTASVQPYQKVVDLCKTHFSSPDEALGKLPQSWELPEGTRCDVSTCGLQYLFAALELKLPLLGSVLCLDVARLEPMLFL